MPFHWCPEETAALLAAIPVLGLAFTWLRAKFGKAKKRIHGPEPIGPKSEPPSVS